MIIRCHHLDDSICERTLAISCDNVAECPTDHGTGMVELNHFFPEDECLSQCNTNFTCEQSDFFSIEVEHYASDICTSVRVIICRK